MGIFILNVISLSAMWVWKWGLPSLICGILEGTWQLISGFHMSSIPFHGNPNRIWLCIWINHWFSDPECSSYLHWPGNGHWNPPRSDMSDTERASSSSSNSPCRSYRRIYWVKHLYLLGKTPWFPVKIFQIFPEKPIQWNEDQEKMSSLWYMGS